VIAAEIRLVQFRVGIISAVIDAAVQRKENAMMKKSMEVINEAVRSTEHPFRKTDHQPKKALKNRYERRKIKELLHLGDWMSEEAA
jgi:hypothetical protein